VLQLTLNAGKRTVDLDISKENDMNILRKLLKDVDVFIQGFRYGSLDRKGLGLRSARMGSSMWTRIVMELMGRSRRDLDGNRSEMLRLGRHM
jgi:hypothetical protein